MYRALPILTGLLATAILAVLAIVAGAYYYLTPSLPSAETLREVELQTPLRVFSRDGRLMAQIGEKRRTPVRYEDVPQIVIDAFLAAEDDRFFVHPGFDYQGITRAAINLLVTGSRSQGGSTITQQLARVYFLTRERTFIRKAKELILAVQIENEFTKEEILSLYLNKIFLGQRSYGVGAAAEVYFGKSLQDLNVGEAATIAGLPKAPSTLNPVSNVDRATERRAYVLRRMLELGFIEEAVYEEAISIPVESHLYGPKVELEAPYVTEMVRAEMVRRFGLEAYTAGYKVITTIDSRLQRAGQTALRTALLQYDRRHGFRGPVARGVLDELIAAANAPAKATFDAEDSAAVAPSPVAPRGPISDPTELDDMALARLLNVYPTRKDLYMAVVLATGEDNSANLYIRNIGRVTVPWENIRWRPYINDDVIGDAPENVGRMIAAGDLVYMVYAAGRGWTLAQMPQVQGAFVALDPFDGATVALSGGFDFYASKFNRAVQTRRQPGSSFKPFIYSAALENGFTAATLVNDAPVVFDDAALETAWRPENYSRKFHGPTRLREALVKSLNLVSVRILRGTGLGPAIRHIEPFGLPDSALPRDLSLALGSGGASPWDIAAGYATFASGGYRIDHYLIERVLDADNEAVFETPAKVVCSECEKRRHEGQPPGFGPAVSPDTPVVATEIVDADNVDTEIVPELPTEEPDRASEVPAYRSFAAMARHGLEWRPTVEEAPQFFAADDDLAPRVITAENAYLIYDMMRDVIQRGTGRRARELGRPDLAGKTGTSNDRRDAWFSGYNGDIVATAWVGFDQDRSLGAGEEGSRTALPVWKDFMATALAGTEDATIARPTGIITARIVPDTGLVAPAGYGGAIFELFRDGHVPEMDQGDTGGVFVPGEVVTVGEDEEDIF